MNWGQLKALATTYVHRSDLDWDALQNLVVSNVSIALIVQENEATADLALTGPDANSLWSSNLPADYALMRSVSQMGRRLKPVDIGTLVHARGSRYAVSGSDLFTSDAAGVSVVYGARVLPYADDSSTGILLDHYPDVFLYCLLKHAAALIQDPEVNAEFYEAQFLSAVKTANSLYIDAAFGPGTIATPMGGLV